MLYQKFRTIHGVMVCLCLLASRDAVSRDWLFMTGGELSSGSSYAYAGLLAPIKDTSLGEGWVQRYWVDWVRYQYDTTVNKVAISPDANAPGGSVALGYQGKGNSSSYGAYMGIEFRNTDLSPDDPSSDVRGNKWGVRFELQGEQAITQSLRSQGIASFTTNVQSYWLRGRVLHRNESGLTPGVEAIFQGNPDYHGWQVGGVLLGLKPSSNAEIGFKAGIRKNEGQSALGYGGIEISKMF